MNPEMDVAAAQPDDDPLAVVPNCSCAPSDFLTCSNCGGGTLRSWRRDGGAVTVCRLCAWEQRDDC